MLRELNPPSLTRHIAKETNLWVEYAYKGNNILDVPGGEGLV
jgi:hypothetical protein